jgi:hypothetical protein
MNKQPWPLRSLTDATTAGLVNDLLDRPTAWSSVDSRDLRA